jgi:hypothetical protein
MLQDSFTNFLDPIARVWADLRPLSQPAPLKKQRKPPLGAVKSAKKGKVFKTPLNIK